jgi:predicted deacetylase
MERRRKMRLMEEFLMHMHDKMETDEKFVSIINQLREEGDNQ